MPASIEDVAKKANVSISTVSRVLNRRDVVNAATRKRVEQAIKELGYRPNMFARGLMLRKSHILGLMLPDLHGEFYSEIIRGANLKSRERGYHVLLSSVTVDDDGQDIMSTVSTPGFVDGLIVMVSEMNSRIRTSLADVGLPLVVLDGTIDGVRHDSVVIDQRRGAKGIMDHLVQTHPNKRVVFIGGHESNFDTIDRLASYREVLQSTGRQPDEKDIYHLDYSYESAFDLAIEKVLDWTKDQASVFAANDEMAAGVIDAALAAKLSVPGDLFVVGFDDTRIAQLTRPRMTTVHVPMANMGATAIDLLCDRLEEPERPVTKVTLQAELVVRESCGASL